MRITIEAHFQNVDQGSGQGNIKKEKHPKRQSAPGISLLLTHGES
jgi:hypothetical protein